MTTIDHGRINIGVNNLIKTACGLDNLFVDNCGMTQSIAFIRTNREIEARKYKKILEHPLYKFVNNICPFLKYLTYINEILFRN